MSSLMRSSLTHNALNPAALSVGRAAFGALTLVAVSVQLVAASRTPDFYPANFFGYFTILSNLLAALVFIFVAIGAKKAANDVDVVRGAATLALALVGIIFSALLANLESTVIPWVNVVVHYVMPIVAVIDWLVDPPGHRLRKSEALWWLAFPLVYVTYTLIRGSIVHWYPYPFLNVDELGAAAVAAYVAGIVVVTTTIATLVFATGNTLRARRDALR